MRIVYSVCQEKYNITEADIKRYLSFDRYITSKYPQTTIEMKLPVHTLNQWIDAKLKSSGIYISQFIIRIKTYITNSANCVIYNNVSFSWVLKIYTVIKQKHYFKREEVVQWTTFA